MKKHIQKVYAMMCAGFYRVLLAVLTVFSVRLYQPLFGLSDEGSATRACEDRWAAIEPHLPATPGSVLDIGCNIGFFSFSAGQKGFMVHGVDADPFYLIAAASIKHRENAERVFFLRALIDKAYLEAMPAYDVVFNFSVFHHWVKAYGAEQAQEMLRILAGKTRTLFFETGQPDEAGTKWAEKLSFMGDEPNAWIENFLRDAGFDEVQVIGTFATGLTAVERYMFCAKRV